MIWVIINRFAVWSHLNEELRGERVLWHRPWVPVRSRVSYTELGTVILGGGGWSSSDKQSDTQSWGQLYWGGGESSSDLQSSIQSWEQLYWGVGGSLTVVFGWRSVAEEPVLLTCWLVGLWVYLWFGEVNRELEIITSFQNNNRTKKADKFHRKLMTSVRTFVE